MTRSTLCLLLVSSMLWCACSARHGEQVLTRGTKLDAAPSEVRRTYCTRQDAPLCQNLRGTQSPEVARALLEESCQEHQLDACVTLSGHLDATSRQKLLVQTCSRGHAPACELAALGMLDRSSASLVDLSHALDMGLTACRAGKVSSCHLLADHGAITRQQERTFYDAACNEGTLLACHELAMMDLDPGRTTRLLYDASTQRLEDLCEQGVARSCAMATYFSTQHSSPWTLVPDYLTVHQRREVACQRGDAESCLSLAQTYSRGSLHVDRDAQQAEQLFLTACQLGEVEACPHVSHEEMMRHPSGIAGLYQELARGAPPGKLFELAVQLVNQTRDVESYRWGLGQIMRLCEEDVMYACHVLWEGYALGSHYMTPDEPKAEQLARRLCAQDKPLIDICPEQSTGAEQPAHDALCHTERLDECVHMLARTTSEPERQRALDELLDACEQGQFQACGVLSTGFEQGLYGLEPHALMSRFVLARPCHLDPSQCAPLADALLRGTYGLPVSIEQASSMWQNVCADEGDCIGGAEAYLDGRGDHAPQPSVGVKLLETRCISGKRRACEALAEIHAQGKYGVAVDAEQAQKWRWRACRAESHMDVCLPQAIQMVKSGKTTKGVEMFERACELGSREACYMLSEWLSQATDEPTLARGFVASERACALYVWQGCMQLATFYRTGKGGAPRDEREATAILERICQRHHEEACEELEKIR